MYCINSIIIHTGKGERESCTREKGRGATGESTDQKAVETTNMTECTQEVTKR
jgi:hypothetical protein